MSKYVRTFFFLSYGETKFLKRFLFLEEKSRSGNTPIVWLSTDSSVSQDVTNL